MNRNKQPCRECHGSGRVTVVKKPDGRHIKAVCPVCGGSGRKGLLTK